MKPWLPKAFKTKFRKPLPGGSLYLEGNMPGGSPVGLMFKDTSAGMALAWGIDLEAEALRTRNQSTAKENMSD